ncbi:peroxiredoxin-like family protein [Sphaerotilus uruguayifluvii]|uniref:thioredoxin-dependent peroxiredoxin n=1 Tax=Sphaerotilus uruguayifluvii TaxID=2735897 RepID=A0ABX2G2T2_9BURK|nr:peroxiredoxin-like family protein [Leptothrix sp. C29]NRT56606.1 peroxiredoxin [Leptothrix sp. C29]
MSLQQELDDFMAHVRTQVPAEVLAPVERFYAQDLQSAGRFPDVLQVGDLVPLFELPDAHGRPVRLADLLARGPVVLSFYRGAWCPFCNMELRSLQRVLPELQALGASLVAISPELPDHSLPLVEREGLSFPVLTDLGNTVARQFGIVFPLEGEVRRISLEVFQVDLPRFNGDASWDLPVPATFVIAPDRSIRLAFFDPEFRHRVEPQVVVQAVRDTQA